MLHVLFVSLMRGQRGQAIHQHQEAHAISRRGCCPVRWERAREVHGVHRPCEWLKDFWTVTDGFGSVCVLYARGARVTRGRASTAHGVARLWSVQNKLLQCVRRFTTRQ